MSLKKIRQAMEILVRQLQSDQPLVDVTLLSDGQTIYAAHSADEVVDVFRRARVSLGSPSVPVQAELVGQIHQLFPELAETGAPAAIAAAGEVGAN